MSRELKRTYDIIINGGGIVGFTLLNLISKSPYLNKCKTLLIEQVPKPVSLLQAPRIVDTSPENGPRFSNRVSSITPASKNAFRDLNLWNEVENYAKSVKAIKVWNYNFADSMIFTQVESRNNQDLDEVFSVVENNRLSAALLNNIHVVGKDNESILWNHSLQHMDESSTGELVEVIAVDNKTGEEFSASASLILGCDGHKSKIRDLSGLSYHEYNLEKSAVVGTVKMKTNQQSSLNEIAYQRFSSEKDTVAALLPLDSEYSSFVISAPTTYSTFLMESDDEAFTSEFNELLSKNEIANDMVLKTLHNLSNMVLDKLPLSIVQRVDNTHHSIDPPCLEYVLKNSRASFPLLFGTTTPKMIASLPGKQYSQIALLGDSSHRVHPLAGQGLNLGIQDCIELVEQIEAIMKCGERVFNKEDNLLLDKVLRRFELKRQSYIVPMTAGIFAMQPLFKLLPPKLLSTVDKLDFIKSFSVKMANGRR